MSINVNCCEGLSVQRILCNCNWSKKRHKTKDQQVVYTDCLEQIIILSTPHIELPDLIPYTDLQNTDIAVFSLDAQNEVRFTSLQGRNLFQIIERQAPLLSTAAAAAAAAAGSTTLHPLSTGDGSGAMDNVLPLSARDRRSESRHSPSEHKAALPSIGRPEDVAGRTFQEVLPEYMLKFLLPICETTLQGNFLQLTIMWNKLTQLVRTYPILDHRQRIVAGMLTLSPFNAANVDVNRFAVGNVKPGGSAPRALDSPPSPQVVLPATGTTTTATTTPADLAAMGSAVLGNVAAPKRRSKPEVMVMK